MCFTSCSRSNSLDSPKQNARMMFSPCRAGALQGGPRKWLAVEAPNGATADAWAHSTSQ